MIVSTAVYSVTKMLPRKHPDVHFKFFPMKNGKKIKKSYQPDEPQWGQFCGRTKRNEWYKPNNSQLVIVNPIQRPGETTHRRSTRELNV
jgi:hypothetical protein